MMAPIETTYPITGPLLPYLLVLECVVCFVYLEIGIMLGIRARIKRKELRIMQEKAFIGLFIGYGLMWLFGIYGDYYTTNPQVRMEIYNIGHIAIAIGANIFVYEIEKSKVFFKKRYFTFTIAATSIIFLYLTYFNKMEYSGYAINIFWPFLFLFLTLYLKKLILVNRKKKELHNFHLLLFEFALGSSLLIVGYGLTTDTIREILQIGLEVRLFGDILQVIASIFIVLFIISTPSFSEYDWQEKIDRILIMHKSGLLLFEKKFHEDLPPLDGTYMSGILTTLKLMLERVVDKESASIIEKQDKILIIQPGKSIFGVLICNEMLNSLRILLSNLINKIEAIYSNILENWKGDLKIFAPIDEIVNDIFF